MNKNALVSIGIAFRNPGRVFEDCLKSVFAQTMMDWELLLLDDQSTDSSLTLARRVDDPRVRVYSDGHRRGLSCRLNELVQLAKGKYFFRMDSDDIMHPERLRRQVAELERSDDSTVIGSQAYSLSEDGEVLGLRKHPPITGEGFRVRRSFIHPTVAADRQWFLRNRYSEDLLYHRCEDAELWCRTRGSSKFLNLSEPLLYYRETGPFLFERYAATATGCIAILASRFRKPTLRFATDLAKETSKLLLYGLVTGTRLQDHIISRKYVKLPTPAQEAAELGLERVRRTALPLKRAMSEPDSSGGAFIK